MAVFVVADIDIRNLRNAGDTYFDTNAVSQLDGLQVGP